eukprot:1229815-Alexandrium_andersonii.AAC.1
MFLEGLYRLVQQKPHETLVALSGKGPPRHAYHITGRTVLIACCLPLASTCNNGWWEGHGSKAMSCKSAPFITATSEDDDSTKGRVFR